MDCDARIRGVVATRVRTEHLPRMRKAVVTMTNGGPQYLVHRAWNLRLFNEFPCATQALRNRKLAMPIENHAI